MLRITQLFAGRRWRGGTRWISGLVVAATLAAAACSGSDSTGPGGVDAGEHMLTKVGFDPPPVTIHHGPWLDPNTVTFWNLYHFEITGAVLELDGEVLGEFLG